MIKVLGVNSDTHICEHCGKTHLKKVVALQFEDGQILNYGVICAAKALGKSASVMTADAKAIETVDNWFAKGYTAEQIAKGIWNKFGYSTEVKNGNLIAHGLKVWAL